MNHIGFYLRKIYFNKLSGQLVFKRGPVQKILFFQAGDLVEAKTNVPEERLGEILFKLGKISDEAHSEIERYIEPHQPLGKSLIKKGLTSQRNVQDGVAYQIREISLSLFPHFDAGINFSEKALLAKESFTTRINIPYLIEDGIRRMKFDPELQRYLEKRVPFPRDRTFFSLLTEEEKEMMEKIKGGTTGEALWRTLKYNPEFFWKTLYLFYCLNLIDFRDKEEIPEQKREEKKEEPMSQDLKEQLEEVLAFGEKISSMNYYQVLRVSKNASEEEIKTAYFQLARKFHPDRFDRLIIHEHGEQIAEVFDKITKAYRTLVSSDLKKDYDLGKPVGEREEDRDLGKKAEIKFRQAKTLYAQGRYEDALFLLDEAIRYKKTKADFFLLLAMTESKIPAYSKRAEEHFLKAIGLEPWNAEGYVGLGILYKAEGLILKATKMFQKALEVDADHDLARRELKALGKGGKKGGLKGLFSMDIFGSKKK